MSNRLTFSLASLIVFMIAGLTLLTPGIVEAADPTFGTGTVSAQNYTVGVEITKLDLPKATDADEGDTISYTESGLPTGLTFFNGGTVPDPNPEGLKAGTPSIYGIPAAGATVGLNIVTLTATSTGSGDTPATLQFTITIKANSPPTFPKDEPEYAFKEGDFVNQVIATATDVDGDDLTYAVQGDDGSGAPDGTSVTTLIAGLVLSGNTILGTATLDADVAETTYHLIVTATDDNDATATASRSFKVSAETNREPKLTAVSNLMGTVGKAITNHKLPTVAAANINTGEKITYELTPALPAGLSYQNPFDDSHFITGDNPQEAVDKEYTWKATDPDGESAMVKFQITISAAPVPVAFAVTSYPNQTFEVGATKEVLLPMAMANTGSGTLTYSLDPTSDSDTRPDWLMFDADTRILSGMPEADDVAAAVNYTYKVTDSAVDDDGEADPTSATLTFDITVTDPGAPVAVALTTTIADMTYTVGDSVSEVLPEADSGTGTAPLTYALYAPAADGSADTTTAITMADAHEGLMFDPATRTLSGDPTDMADGTYTYKVTDSADPMTEAMQTFMITVSPAGDEDDDITQPTNVMARANADGTVDVTWEWMGADATETAALAGFTVMWNPSMDVAADQTSYTIPAHLLTPGEDTTVSVLARAMADSGYATPAAGTSAPSAVVPVDTTDLRFEDPVTGALVTELPDLTLTAGTEITDGTNMYIQLPRAIGGVGDITYSLRKGAGEADVTAGDNGLMVNLTDLRLHGTPIAAATIMEYQWRATDARGEADVKGVEKLIFNITVNPAENRAPVYDPATALTITGVVDTRITAVDASATDPDGDTLTYSWDVDEAALGLALDTATGMITGIPKKVHTGTHPVTASDGTLTAMRDVNVTITAAADTMNPTVTITVLSKDANGKHMVDPAGTVRFELLFSEPLWKGVGPNLFEVEDFFIFHSSRGLITRGATLSKPIDTGVAATTGPGNQEKYVLTVPVISPDPTGGQEVIIELLGFNVLGGQVADTSGNKLLTPAVSKFDTIPPDVRISVVGATAVSGTPFTFSGEPKAKLTFRFAFTETLSPAFTTTDIHRSVGGDNFRLLADSDPRPVPGVPNAYTVVVTVIDLNQSTTVLIKRLEVSDAAKNQLQNDRHATYAPTTTAPVATITATGPFNCGIDGNPVTVTITDNEAIGTGQGIAASEITVSTGWQIRTGSFRASATARSATANFNVVRKDVENGADRSWLGIQEVKITVAADAVKDDTNRGNAAKAMSYTAGPVITVPAGQYVVVIRDNAWRTSHLNFVRTLFLGDYNVRAENVQVQAWDCMPDLGLIFDVTVDASPGIGGGGLMVLQSRDHTGTAIAKGTVGISEIMWSEDRGLPFGATSNLQHAREQWIELHNTNSFDVKVTLFDLIRTEAYRTNDASRAGLIDVMSNYDIGGRWDVQEKDDNGNPKYGTDGNSEFGHDFVSMKRVAPAADKNYAHGEKQGRAAGHWSASTSIYYTKRAGLAGTGQIPLDDLNYHFVGSPGRANTFSAPGPITRTNLPKNLIFNEVSNRRDQTLEWIELKNVSDAEINLRRYVISLVTAKGTDTKFYEFPDNDDIKLAAGELLLLLDTDPRDNDAHPIAVAFNRDAGNDQGLGIGANAIKYKVANFAEGGLPDDGKFVLLLRGHKGVEKLKTHERVIDAIGYDDNLGDPAIHTNLWPLKYFNGALDARNTIAVETVHRRQHRIDPDKNTHGDDKDEHQALRDVGYTGIGYKRHAQRIAAHGGTPGHEDTRKNEVPQVTATGTLTISEIMFDQGDGQYPQWIEIYNSSETDPVNLHAGDHGWRLIIENFDDGEIPVKRLSGTLNFRSSDVQTILPQQTVMIASTRARNSGSAFFDTRVVFPATRVFSVWDDARGELDMKRSTDPILSTQGFYIELIDGKGNFADGVGNLVKSPNRRAAQDIVWELSEVTGEMMEDGRSSILRRYREYKDGKVVGRYTDAEIEDMGVEAEGWMAAYKTDFRDVRQTWYGHPDDYGSPGITGGRVLPVELSKFRPERLDSGEIVIRWITQSELNNAGFNILRSEKADGEFKQINTKLIAGHGTTSERHTYEWKDTSAKPNVVYYYQIQDVSLDGKVQTLAQTRLKGHVSPAGKATTTWGELKALQ